MGFTRPHPCAHPRKRCSWTQKHESAFLFRVFACVMGHIRIPTAGQNCSLEKRGFFCRRLGKKTTHIYMVFYFVASGNAPAVCLAGGNSASAFVGRSRVCRVIRHRCPFGHSGLGESASILLPLTGMLLPVFKTAQRLRAAKYNQQRTTPTQVLKPPLLYSGAHTTERVGGGTVQSPKKIYDRNPATRS